MQKRPAAKKTPNVHRAKIRFGKIIGMGQRQKGHIVEEALIVERDARGKEIARHAAVAKRRKFAFDTTRKELAQMQSAYRSFRNAGLPVPAFSTVFMRRKGPDGKPEKRYLMLFAENMKAKHGPLIDVHLGGEPLFLRKLAVSKDAGLIKELASDFATISRLGYSTTFIDFWHFYRKPEGGYGRVIVDLDGFFRSKPDKSASHGHGSKFWLRSNFHEFKDYMGKKEFELFCGEYTRLSGERIPDLTLP